LYDSTPLKHTELGNTLVHRLDPRTKIVLVFAFAITVVSTPPHRLAAYIAYAGMLTWVAAWAGVSLATWASRAATVLPFSLLAACWLPFAPDDSTVVLWDGRIELSERGLWLLAGVAMKSYLGASVAILLVTTTRFHQLLSGLRRLGMPAILVDMLGLTYRYLFVLVEEAGRLRRAAAARGYRPTWIGQATLIGRLVGQLFLRAYERAERVYGAMVLRGYQGRMPTTQPLVWRLRDGLTLAFVLPVLVWTRWYLA